MPSPEPWFDHIDPRKSFVYHGGMEPSYLSLHSSGELARRVERARDLLASCELCARRCRVNRLEGDRGECRAPLELTISSAGPHFGEEPPLVGRGGSGTIFLTHCPLGCDFCQNHDISHGGRGTASSPGDLASQMIALQGMGCHNINFVTPSHYLPQILEALPMAVEAGLGVPIVWNCGGYEAPEALRLLEGIVDIYMPDYKFALEEPARRYCRAPDYPEVVREALKEMQRQVGDLDIDARGIARRGLLIRHLVMPGMPENTRLALEFIAREISREAYVNIMDQYHPAYRSGEHPEISRRITPDEYRDALEWAGSLGLHRGFEDTGSGLRFLRRTP